MAETLSLSDIDVYPKESTLRMTRCTAHHRRISAFMRKAQQEVPNEIKLPDEQVRLLRARLILEEAMETIHALGFEFNMNGPPAPAEELVVDCGHDTKLTLKHGPTPNLVEIVDGCADISVVTIGTLIACGVPDMPFLQEVDRSNLDKFGPGSYLHGSGKWIKPVNHQPPRIRELLALCREERNT